MTIRRIAAAHRARGRRVLIVVSALSGITDQLKAIAEARADEARCRVVQATIVERHAAMRADLELPDCARLGARLDELDRLIADPRRDQAAVAWQAEVFALGELMSSALGAQFLGSGVDGLAARVARRARVPARRSPAQSTAWGRYLSATVPIAHDGSVGAALAAQGEVFITQGFIARNAEGETVLLGRGGSDTSPDTLVPC